MLIAAAPSIIVTSVEFGESMGAGITASMHCSRSSNADFHVAIAMVDTLDFHARKTRPSLRLLFDKQCIIWKRGHSHS